MSRRSILHKKLYGTPNSKGGMVATNFPRAKVVGEGKWLQNGSGKGETVTLPSKR